MGKFIGNVDGAAIEETMQEPIKEAKKSTFDAKNYLDTKLGENETSRNITIRILPVSCEDGNFRVAVKTHSLKVNHRIAKSGFKSFLCLNDTQIPNYDPNVKCPLCSKAQEWFDKAREERNKANEARKENDEIAAKEFELKSKEYFIKGCSYQHKTTYIVRAIERGKEDEGVKFLRFNHNSKGEGIYDKLMALYKQRKVDMAEEGIENYNIFDLENGRDIVLQLTKTTRADGKDGVTIMITDKSINKPLSQDVEQANQWISDVKRWYDAYTVKSAEYLSIIADDKIPFFDKSEGKFVPKTENDFIEYENRKNQQSIGEKEVKATPTTETKMNDVIGKPSYGEEEECELPF